MKDREIKNAQIRSTHLGYEDHGILTAILTLDYGDVQQGFGLRALDGSPPDGRGARVPTTECGRWIAEVLQVVGVSTWEELPGKYVRVDGSFGKIHRIGHLLVDRWFEP